MNKVARNEHSVDLATDGPGDTGYVLVAGRRQWGRDDSPAARAYIDEPDDVTMSFTREQFLTLHGEAARRVVIEQR
jgi:hypothetical protein